MKRIESHIIYDLLKSKKNLWELLSGNQYTIKEFIFAINELFRKGLIGIDKNEIYLTDEGLKKVNREILGFKIEVCEECEGKRVLFNGKFKDVLERFKEIVKSRPPPSAEFFQGYMRERDVISRVALMHHYDDLANKAIILIGDDDLLSIALSLTNLPSRILVLDIDERLKSFIEEVNKDNGSEIEFRKYDVSNPLPNDLIRQFDVFSSEPLETLSGLKAFISRGISCLKDNSSGYVGLSTAEASRKKWMDTERLLLKMNCVITDIIRDFSMYRTLYETVDYEKFTIMLRFPVEANPGIYWYKSSLLRFEVIGKPEPVVKPDEHVLVKYVDKRDDVTNPLLYGNCKRKNF